MDEEEVAIEVVPVEIHPINVYGLRTDVIGNIHFNVNQEVIYPVEGVLAFHDYTKNKQKFLRFPEYTEPQIIVMSPNRKLLAILEWYHYNVDSISIAIYDLSTLRKRRTIKLPDTDLTQFRVKTMAFTSDSKAFMVLSKPPEDIFFLFLMDRADTVLQCRATNPNVRGIPECIASNPNEPGLIAIAGDNLFKLILKAEKGFTVSAIMKPSGICITSMAWLTNTTVIAGTNTGCLLFIESTAEIKGRFDAFNSENINLIKEVEAEESFIELINPEKSPTVSSLETDANKCEEKVLCMTVFPRGFAYVIFNRVYVYEKDTRVHYERKTIITLHPDLYPSEMYDITNMAINPQLDTVIVTSKHAQIYVGILIEQDALKTKMMDFRTLGEPICTDEIIDVSICAWKPIIMTASKDQTVRIWNYETGKVELVKKYQVDICVIELNPTGFFAAVGFSDQLRIMEIFLDDLIAIKTYNFPSCRDVVYSNYGHLMAAAHDNLIAITSVFSLEILQMLKGHCGDVLSVAWSYCDKYLMSGGTDGAVYQWDIETGIRIHEVVHKGIEYRCLQVTHDPLSTYAITSLGTLREIIKSEVVREIETSSNGSLLSATLSRSDLIMFMSSTEGHLYNIQLPFMEAGGGTIINYRFFNSGITRVRISYCGTLLITASKLGTLAIWIMKNIEGRVTPIDQDLLKCAEVLIRRRILTEKLDEIASLNVRMQDQLKEFQYQINQTKVFENAQVEKLHQSYCKAIDELKEKNNQTQDKYAKELNKMTEEMNTVKKEHDNKLNQLATQFSDRMLVEFQKIQALRNSVTEMREGYEAKLRAAAGGLQDTIEALEIDFKKQLHERQELIRQLMQEMEDKKLEFIEYCRQVEMDNDRNMVESQQQYEKKLKNEKDETLKWRGEAGILRKQYDVKLKESETLQENIETLVQEQEKYKKEIADSKKAYTELQKEIEERDYALIDKEKRIQELQNKNQELEKYKTALNHKIVELKNQFEPMERQIKDKRNQIAEMERELENLQHNSAQLELQLLEMKDKYLGCETELRVEKQRSRLAKNHILKICSDIYLASSFIDRPEMLKTCIKDLFKKYSNNSELKKTILHDAQVQNEFHRQREYVERTAKVCKKLDQKRAEGIGLKKLLNENVTLLAELNNLRHKYKEAQRCIGHMKSIIGVNWGQSNAPAAKLKLEKAAADFDKIQEEHMENVQKLQDKIDILTMENKEQKEQLLAVKSEFS